MKKKIYSILAVELVVGLLSGCNEKTQTSDTPGTSDVLTEYTITFNPCNGNPNDIIRLKGVTGTVLTLPSCGDLNGQPFLGWSTKYNQNRKMGDQSGIVTSYTVGTENAILYACYSSAEIGAYMTNLKNTSTANHLYYHYLRYKGDYAPWDVWAWPYKPNAGEGDRATGAPSARTVGYGSPCGRLDLRRRTQRRTQEAPPSHRLRRPAGEREGL